MSFLTRDEIIRANPLPRFLTERGHGLWRAGTNFVTNACPEAQHKMDHRCVTIDTEKNLFHCNDCDKGGTVIDWEVLEKNISIAEAMQMLGGGNNGSREIVSTYDYTDENGKLLFQTVRYEPKDFRQRRPDGNGGWIWNLKGVPRVLYRLPEVLKAQVVCVAEGEKDCDNLCKLGFTATTNPIGAGKWRVEYGDVLRGKDALILDEAKAAVTKLIEEQSKTAPLTSIAPNELKEK